jgi:hypothetical protein
VWRERDSEGVWVVCVFVERERERLCGGEVLCVCVGVCVKHKDRKGEFIHRVGLISIGKNRL